MTAEDARAALQPEADRLGIPLEQYIDILVSGATDALEAAIAQWQREQEQEAA